MTKEELKQEAEVYSYKLYHSKAWNPGEDMLVKAYLAGAEPREKRIAELEAQIEKMKCCANCVFSESDRLNGTFCHKEGCFVLASAKCKLWER